MSRFKRGLAILLSTCMIGGMMPLPAGAVEKVSGNTVQTESGESIESAENTQKNTSEQESTSGQESTSKQENTTRQESTTSQENTSRQENASSQEETSKQEKTKAGTDIQALMGMEDAKVAMLAANVATPKYFNWNKDKTLDVSTVPTEEINAQVYTMDTKDAVYTITGKNSNHTALRFVIEEDCTIVLDNTIFTAGLSYQDGKDISDINNIYTGWYPPAHGVFEVGEGKKVTFRLKGTNQIEGKSYQCAWEENLLGILLQANATVEFTGSGVLRLENIIGQRILPNYIWNGKSSNVIMTSGTVYCGGFANSALRADNSTYYTPAGAINFQYNGGWFYNYWDDNESWSNYYTRNRAVGAVYRVEISVEGYSSGWIKVGVDGTWSAWSDAYAAYKLYAWQDSTDVKDYYVICNGKYYHYQSKAYADGSYTTGAVDVTSEKDTIGGFSGTVKGSGKGIANAGLTFVREDTDGIAYTGTCTTDSTGQYYVALPPGTYTVKLKFSTGELTYGEKFSLSEEKESNKNINVGAVSGTITDKGNNPLSGAWVTVQQGSNVFTTQTDDNGYYAIVPVGFTETSFDIRVAYKMFKEVSGTLTWNHSSGRMWDSSIDTSLDTSEIHIASEEDLLRLAKNVTDLSDKIIILDNDIMISSGANGFKGIDYTGITISNLTFKGNGYTISGMTRPLFHTGIEKQNTNQECLENCIFESLHLRGNIEIPCNNRNARYGALCGWLSGSESRIEECSFEGSILLNNQPARLGGLVGTLNDSATIENSYVKLSSIKAEASLMGNSFYYSVGGICGLNAVKATIKNCYVIVDDMQWGSDTDLPYAGVITGNCANQAFIRNCYGVIKKAKKNINLYGQQSDSKISGYISGDGAETSDTAYITMEKVAAAPGTENALVDRLNSYVNENSTISLKKWVITANGYPEFQSLNNVSAEDVMVTYDGSPHSIEVNGVPEGATITYSTNGISYSSNKPSVTDVTDGTTIYYRVQLDTKEKNGSAKVMIKPVEIGITWGATTFDYDGSRHLPTATATGMVGNDTLELTVSTTSGNATDAASYTAKVTGITGIKAGNYKLPADVTTSFTINPVSLGNAVITVSDEASLTYTGREQKPGITVTLGDKTLTANTDYTVAYTDNINATTDTSKATVTITGKGNYKDTADEQFAIKKAALTVKAEDKTIKYGEEPHFTAAYEGFVNGETKDTAGVLDGTLTFACDYRKADGTDTAESSNSNVGKYMIMPGGLTGANYEISFAEGKLTVGRAAGQVTIASVGEKTYGDADFVLTADKHGSDGALTYTSSNPDVLTVDADGRVTLKKAGTASVTVDMAEGTNHTEASKSIDITIAKKAAKLEVSDLNYTASYGDEDISLGLTTEGESTVTYESTDEAVATAADGKIHIVGTGDAAITLSMEESTNYLAKNVGITIKVNPAPLTITAEDKTADYGTDAPAFTVKYDGFKNGDAADTEGVLTGTLSFDCSYQKSSASNGKAGTYDITPGGLSAKNYKITFVKGTLTVGKVSSSVTIGDIAAKTYGDAAFSLPVTKSGSTAELTYACSDTSVLTVDDNGRVTIKGAGTAIVAVTLPGDDNHNQAEDSVDIIVNKKALTVTADDKNIIYKDEAPAYTAGYDGFVNGETQDTRGVFDGTLTFTCDYRKADDTDTAESSNSNAGRYTITPGGLTSANYEISFVNGTLKVGRAAGQMSVAPVSEKTYGDADFALTTDKHGSDGVLTYTSSDEEVLTVDRDGMVTIKQAGTATVTVAMTEGTNYLAPADAEVTIKVNPAPLTITAENKTIDYGTDAPAFTVKYDGFRNGDKAGTEGVLTGTLGFDCKYKKNDVTNGKAGTYDIMPQGLTAKNYIITYVKGTLTVREEAAEPADDADNNNGSAGAAGENGTHTHSYISAMTKAPTTTEEGIMTYTCAVCGDTYTQPIAKIKASADNNQDGGNSDQNPEQDAGDGTDNGNANSGQNITASGAGNETRPSTETKPSTETRPSTDARPSADARPSTEVRPYLRDDSGKEGWDVIKAQLGEAKSGETVVVAMNGTTVVPKDIFDSIRSKNVALVLDMGDGMSWKINGQDIVSSSGDIDFGVTVGKDAGKSIPVDVINNVTGERYSVNLTLAYDGEFGFKATLTVNMESKNAGLYANLFYYNRQAGKLEFVSAGQIDSDGNVELTFTHASDYTIVIDTAVMNGTNNENVTDENITVAEDNRNTRTAPVIFIIIGICILMIAAGAVIIGRKKRQNISDSE